MSENLPSVTVVVPARPSQTHVEAVTACADLDYPSDRLEIIVVRGKQPSIQRNAAIRAAQGEIIYFLDDDSVPLRSNLRRAMTLFADPSVQMVGGPNCCPPSAPRLEQVFALVLASWLAFGPSRARYTPVGTVRATSEKELILCNLAARRKPLLELGGFNEALYPNEENALMDTLQQRGGKLMYDPEFLVYRRPRANLRAFAKMLMTYGRGRAEQFRQNPTPGSILNFIPPLFCLFLVWLPFSFLPGLLLWRNLSLALLGIYGAVVVIQALVLAASGGGFRSIPAIPLIIMSHVLYGAGFWRGLFTRFKPVAERVTHAEVKLETMSLPMTGARSRNAEVS